MISAHAAAPKLNAIRCLVLIFQSSLRKRPVLQRTRRWLGLAMHCNAFWGSTERLETSMQDGKVRRRWPVRVRIQRVQSIKITGDIDHDFIRALAVVRGSRSIAVGAHVRGTGCAPSPGSHRGMR